MIALVLGLFLLQAAPQGTGFVTGVVRASNGSPAAKVRVYAITYRDAVEAATLPPALESLTETDPSGRYRLELQPGRYTIATGSVVAPTYYPGTPDISAARVITVARDLIVPDVDFGAFVPAVYRLEAASVVRTPFMASEWDFLHQPFGLWPPDPAWLPQSFGEGSRG